MPNTKSQRRGVQEPSRRAKLSEKSSSFHGRLPATMQTERELRRPKTLPDLLQDRSVGSFSSESKPKKLTKLLLNVTIQGSVGAVQVIVSAENTVADLVATAVKQYVKECRRPMLANSDPSGFDLHYSQFCLESLGRGEKLMELGSRNFILCPRKAEKEGGNGDVTTSSSTCSKEAGKASKTGIPWLKFMDFLL